MKKQRKTYELTSTLIQYIQIAEVLSFVWYNAKL